MRLQARRKAAGVEQEQMALWAGAVERPGGPQGGPRRPDGRGDIDPMASSHIRGVPMLDPRQRATRLRR
jgi:hypothetical protein